MTKILDTEEERTMEEEKKNAPEKENSKAEDELLDDVPEEDKKAKDPQITVLGKKQETEPVKEEKPVEVLPETKIFSLRTTANREDQVMDFISSNAKRKKIPILSVIRPHGMRGYIFIEAKTKEDAEQSAYGIPYARGILSKEIQYKEIEHMLEQVKKEVNIQKNDIAEIISGPFKREKCKVTRIDKVKEEVVVELLEAAVPIPITVKLDAIKVIRREHEEEEK
jgi:transcription termination/antitermination protein NusG